MKRLTALLLLLALVMTSACADGLKVIDRTEDRGITLAETAETNPVQEGISPTTGLPLDGYTDIPDGFLGYAVTGSYMPMLAQVDNSSGGVGKYAQWGVYWADIVYETPLAASGYTRLSVLFSDVIPDSVGPIRSARVGHVWLLKEWNGGFIHYGGQKAEGANIQEEFTRMGIKRGVTRFDGTDGTSKPWKQYFSKRSGCKSPHDKSANAAALSTLIPEDHTASLHPFLFTDEMPTAGDEATEIYITPGADDNNSHLVYSAEEDRYYRYMIQKSGDVLYEDRDGNGAVTFTNVIVQFTTVSYNAGAGDQPVMKMVGEGNADIFIGGRHIAGYWKRADYDSRTVYYDADGNEIALRRGRTLISVQSQTSKRVEVSYK